MPENMQFGWEIFTLRPIVYITVDFKKVFSNLFHHGSISGGKQMYQEKNEAIGLAQKT